MSLTLTSYIDGIQKKTLDSGEILETYIAKSKSSTLNAYITLTEEYARHQHDQTHVSQLPLCGAPICLKDNIATQWIRTTCASKILDNYIAPYDATCRSKLRDTGATLIAKANMDEFAMWSSNENSAYGAVQNPYDPSRIAGWSSGWVASAVAGDLCLAGLWTDTGGSVRQPAALCGVVGIKPTYGRVSRYGVMPMGNSLDQVWVIAKNLEDTQIMLSSISGYDPKDAHSVDKKDHHDWHQIFQNKEKSLQGTKIAIFEDFFWDGLDPEIADQIKQIIAQIQDQWWIVDYIRFPLLSYCLPVYYTLCPAEVSTNLLRMDGIKYGLQWDTTTFSNLKQYITAMRSQWFGEEVQRRIIVGTYCLSNKHFQEYYLQANKMRTLISDAMIHILDQYDAILSPTSPEVAWEIGRKTNDPIAMYLADIYTIIANLVGIPAISIPHGFKTVDNKKLPIAYQLMSGHRKEDVLFQIWHKLSIQ